MNTVCLVGHLTRAPVLRVEASGIQTARFSLAVAEPNKADRPYTVFVGLMAWGAMAERCRTLSAGDLVAVSGTLSWTTSKAPCGHDHSRLIVRVREMDVLETTMEVPA